MAGKDAAWFGLGVLGFSLIEYVHHKQGGHLKAFGEEMYRSHQNHHLDPMEGGVTFPEKLKQRAPLVLKAGAAIAAGLGPVLGPRKTAAFVAGTMGGYVYSEWFHHTMHHRAPQNEFERWMWRYHYVHHFLDSKSNIGFSTPIWDFVFGTARVEEEVTVPDSKIPDWPEEVQGIKIRNKKVA